MSKERGKKLVPKGRDVTLVIPRASRRAAELQSLKQIDILAFNQSAEEAFITLVYQLIKETKGNKVTAREVYSEVSYELGISVETAKRYLIKHTARRASFGWDDGKVIIRSGVQVAVSEEQTDEETEQEEV